MQSPEKFILVIFGGSGDLTKRKLIPALFSLYQQGLFIENFAIVGLGRKEFTDDSYRQILTQSVIEFGRFKNPDRQKLDAFAKHLHYQVFDMSQEQEYDQLASRLNNMSDDFNIAGNYLFYLATPPEFFGNITGYLGKLGLQKNENGWRRVILEKPFGSDLKSAQKLNKILLQNFADEQIYNIDHYLGKETVQNILALRFANGIFEPLWNRNYIHHIEITAAEQIGVENRGGYYDTSGALRDMVQNHLLQLTGIVAMEPPSVFGAKPVRDEKLKVFQAMRHYAPEDVKKHVIRGQYIASTIKGKPVPGYRKEEGVPENSKTETFVALKIYIDNWRWGGVPFYIRTGKMMPTRATEIVVHFNKTPHHMFKNGKTDNSSDNQLVLRVQPDEGILLNFGMKVPGAGFDIKNVGMDFHYSDLTNIDIPEAYERLLLDALIGDSTLFSRVDGVEEAWKFIDPILDAWQKNPKIKLYGYPAGSWGPEDARDLFDDKTEDWRYPCKNLTGDQSFCEL